MTATHLAGILLFGLLCCDAWLLHSTSRAVAPLRTLTQSQRLYGVKPDLFSDDLFEDDDKPAATSTDTKKDKTVAPKKSYLDQKWKLNSEDAKDFKGFPTKGGEAPPPTDAGRPATKVPVFALMYKFRKEYADVSVDSVLADHKGHCAKFKRLLNTELLVLNKKRGVVMLWAGFTESDKDETRADIMRFLEDDPFITKDVVENWDLIDLAAGKGPDGTALPGAVASSSDNKA